MRLIIYRSDIENDKNFLKKTTTRCFNRFLAKKQLMSHYNELMSVPPFPQNMYTHNLLLTQASKAMMGKAISPLAASKHRKCVKATSRLVPSPCVCVSV